MTSTVLRLEELTEYAQLLKIRELRATKGERRHEEFIKSYMRRGNNIIKILKTLIITLLLLLVAYYSYQYLNQENEQLNKEISIDQIKSTQMTKAVYSHKTPNITFVDIKLTDEQINQIVGWINSVPESSIIELHQTPSNISAGIAFRLHSRRDITIQYDLEKIYITRTDIKNKQVKYSIVQNDLKSFFNEQLKGFYYGKDKLND